MDRGGLDHAVSCGKRRAPATSVGAGTSCLLERALAWLSRKGVTVERVMTDNGSSHRSKLFGTALLKGRARHVRVRPDTARTNGKAERFIQTMGLR